MKKVIIINGRGGVGKDTICDTVAKFYKVRNISSITPIVDIAKYAGWNGEKNPASRRMLSQLKQVFTEWGDISFVYCIEHYKQFLETDEQIMFVHIREPQEIARLKQSIGDICQTMLVRRGEQTLLGNASDDSVENYTYDYYFDNNCELSSLDDNVKTFFENM